MSFIHLYGKEINDVLFGTRRKVMSFLFNLSDMSFCFHLKHKRQNDDFKRQAVWYLLRQVLLLKITLINHKTNEKYLKEMTLFAI